MSHLNYPLEIRDFGNALTSFSSAYHDYDVFFDFIDYVVGCLLVEGDKDLSVRLKSKYGRDYNKFNDLFLTFAKTLQTNLDDSFGWFDVLGTAYMALSSKSKSSRFGQFFTPDHICNFMSEITLNKGDKSLKINDCACGSGRLLLSANKVVPGSFLCGEDLDPICAKMCAINLAIHGCQGQVCNMNSLFPDNWYFGYEINPFLYKVGGIPHLVPLSKENSFSVRHWKENFQPKLEPVQLSFF